MGNAGEFPQQPVEELAWRRAIGGSSETSGSARHVLQPSYNNKPNFEQPNTALANVQFGRITGTSQLPRVNQFALKLMF